MMSSLLQENSITSTVGGSYGDLITHADWSSAASHDVTGLTTVQVSGLGRRARHLDFLELEFRS